MKCLDLEASDYDRLCAELDDLDIKSCILQCSDLENDQCKPHQKRHSLDSSDDVSDPSQAFVNLCQLIDDLKLSPDENELYRRNLITPPTNEPTGKEHTQTHAPPKITSNSPTHRIMTLTEILPPNTRSNAHLHTATDAPLPTSFITSASSPTSQESGSTSTSSSPLPQETPAPESSASLSTGAIVGIVLGSVFSCLILWLVIKYCIIAKGKSSTAPNTESKEKPAFLVPEPVVPEKHGNSVSEIDGRVTAYPPGPVQEAIFELSGEPVVVSHTGTSDMPKYSVTKTEETSRKEKSGTDKPSGV